MGESKGRTRRALPGLIALLALSDVAYRLFVRAPLRRSLGIEPRHA